MLLKRETLVPLSEENVKLSVVALVMLSEFDSPESDPEVRSIFVGELGA